MANITTFDGFIERISNGFSRTEPIEGHQFAASVNFGATTGWNMHGSIETRVIPTLESGVDSYIPTAISMVNSTSLSEVIVVKLVDMGSLNIGTPTFTDGSSMGTATMLGSTVNRVTPILAEVTTALNATPGNFTVTYVDQDGNAAETTTSRALPVSAPVGAMAFVETNAGDYAIRDITAATRTGGTSPTGVIQFWGIIPITLLKFYGTGTWIATDDFLTRGLNIVKLTSGDRLGFINLNSSATKRLYGSITYVGDTV